MTNPNIKLLPIEWLLSDLSSFDRNSLEYVELVRRMLRLNPVIVGEYL